MECVRFQARAQATTMLALGHLAFGDMVHRASVIVDANQSLTIPGGGTLALSLLQYRNGAQIGTNPLAVYTFTGSVTISPQVAYEMNPPLTPDLVQYFDDLDVLVLSLAQNAYGPLSFSGLLSWM